MADHNIPLSRPQSSTYPSPHSYPSPSLQPTYAYPPPQGQQSTEQYRASPTGSNMSLPSLNLPPIRSIDGHVPQSQPPPQPSMGSPLPPPVAPMSAYFPHPSQTLPPPGQHMNVTSSPHNMGMRYPLPAQGADQRIMSGGRHKKEIKRRTKTGCLTCRKRRIKCDEAHPTCRNCQKSKRECLGYDPIFKPQPGPPQIQPAPIGAPPGNHIAAATGHTSVPQGYAPVTSGGYGSNVRLGSISSSGSGPDPAYNFDGAIDPALAGADTSSMSVPATSYDGASTLRNDRSSTGSDGQSLKAKRIKVDDLFSLGGIVPPPVPSSIRIEPALYEDIKVLYLQDYAPGIDRFFETTWYSTRGLGCLLTNTRVTEMFAHLVQLLRTTPSSDFEGIQRLRSVEARIVWNLASLCRLPVPPATNGTNGAGASNEQELVREVKMRLSIFENLIFGQVTESNVALQLRYPENLPPQKFYETEFWRHLGHFVSLSDDEASSAKEIDTTLNQCRNILNQLENRDVLYSMAIARHLGARMAEFPDGPQQAFNNDDSDTRTKLFIAKKFIEDEAEGKGTSQVIQRLCGMALRSWVALR